MCPQPIGGATLQWGTWESWNRAASGSRLSDTLWETFSCEASIWCCLQKIEKNEMMAILIASNVRLLANDCSHGMKTHRPGVKSQTPADKTGFLNQLYSTFSLEAASGWNPIQTAIKVPKHLSGPGPVGGRGTLQNGAEQRRKVLLLLLQDSVPRASEHPVLENRESLGN